MAKNHKTTGTTRAQFLFRQPLSCKDQIPLFDAAFQLVLLTNAVSLNSQHLNLHKIDFYERIVLVV